MKQRVTEMQKFKKSKAEKQFAATQKKIDQALKDKEKEQLKQGEQMAGLKALRLAKEAADKELAELEAAEKLAAKSKKSKKSKV